MVSKNLFPSSLHRPEVILFSLGAVLLALALGLGAKAAPPGTGPVTILAAGDIGNCKSNIIKQVKNWWRGEDRFFGGHRTAKLLERHPGTILVLGDLVYRYGRQLDVSKCFHPTWGLFKHRMAPAPGNHDFDDGTGLPGGWGYYRYWGTKAGTPGRRPRSGPCMRRVSVRGAISFKRISGCNRRRRACPTAKPSNSR